MIKKALYRFFIASGDLVDPVRTAARKTVRERLGNRIFNGTRLPRGVELPAMTIAGGSGLVESGLTRPIRCAQPILSFTLHSVDTEEGRDEADMIYESLKSLLHMYRGPLTADVQARPIRLEAEPFDRSGPPIDGTDNWRHRKTFSFLVAHEIAAPAGVN